MNNTIKNYIYNSIWWYYNIIITVVKFNFTKNLFRVKHFTENI